MTTSSPRDERMYEGRSTSRQTPTPHAQRIRSPSRFFLSRFFLSAVWKRVEHALPGAQKAEMEKAMAAMDYPPTWVRNDNAPRAQWHEDEHGNREPPVIEVATASC